MTEAGFIDYANSVCAAMLGEVRSAEACHFVARLCRAQLDRMVGAGDIGEDRLALLTLIVDDILRWEMATREDAAGGKPCAARTFSDRDIMERGTCPTSRQATAPTCT